MSITDYIQSKEELKLMPFMSVYGTILLLIRDGIIDKDTFEVVVKENV
ncbi:MAG: hypothetical protein IKY67_05745 [Paludibacteraceae bacterium]|nr:hypothetical protein [Paludibacteraceae bacterium]